MESRYERQIILPEIGAGGQHKLATSKAVVVGAGGLGSPVLYYLASAGVGNLKIIDGDTVDITNLNRQILHFESDIGVGKARSAMENLRQYNSDVKVSVVEEVLREENMPYHLSGSDVVLSCVDNKKTRYQLNRVCVNLGIPLIDGGVQGFDGYFLMVLPGVTPCYECFFSGKSSDDSADSGVIGAAVGVVGSMMALEAVKYIIGTPIHSYFHYVDTLSYMITTINTVRRLDCPICAGLSIME